MQITTHSPINIKEKFHLDKQVSFSKIHVLLTVLKNDDLLLLENGQLSIKKKKIRWWSPFDTWKHNREARKALKAIVYKIQKSLHEQSKTKTSSYFNSVDHQQIEVDQLFAIILNTPSLHSSIKNSRKMTKIIANHYIGKIEAINPKISSELEGKLKKMVSRIAQFFAVFIKKTRFQFLLSLPQQLKTTPSPVEEKFKSAEEPIKELFKLFFEIFTTERNFNASMNYLLESNFLMILKDHNRITYNDACEISKLLNHIFKASSGLLKKCCTETSDEDSISYLVKILAPNTIIEYFSPFLAWAQVSKKLIDRTQLFYKEDNSKKIIDTFSEQEPSFQDPMSVIAKPTQRLIQLKLLIKRLEQTLQKNESEKLKTLKINLQDTLHYIEKYLKLLDQETSLDLSSSLNS